MTSIVYDLSEAHVTLQSLLVLAIQVCSKGDPHVVAQVRDLEATSPWRVCIPVKRAGSSGQWKFCRTKRTRGTVPRSGCRSRCYPGWLFDVEGNVSGEPPT